MRLALFWLRSTKSRACPHKHQRCCHRRIFRSFTLSKPPQNVPRRLERQRIELVESFLSMYPLPSLFIGLIL
jgi:hypothetical protein